MTGIGSDVLARVERWVRIELAVERVKATYRPRRAHPLEWVVDDHDCGGEGGYAVAVFAGPYAEERATRFADTLGTNKD